VLRRVFLIGLMLLLLWPAGALAHEGHGEVKFVQRTQVGRYPVTVEYSQWPIKAGMHVQVVVRPDDGIAGKSGSWKLIPGPGVSSRTFKRPFQKEPGIDDAWTINIGGMPGNPGPWTWEFQIDGPQGPGTGQLEFRVADPPWFPLWLGWVLGLFPLYGLIWFGVREWRRVRRAIALDGGARA
jgi:hypothetical protein